MEEYFSLTSQPYFSAYAHTRAKVGGGREGLGLGDLEVTEYIARIRRRQRSYVKLLRGRREEPGNRANAAGRWSERTAHPSTWQRRKQDFMPD